MIYVYDLDNQELEVLDRFNLKNRTIIIDQEFSHKREKIKTKQTLREILFSEIDLTKKTDKYNKKEYPLEIIFGENDRQLKISKDIIGEMTKRIGFMKMILMKNPIYNIDGFLINTEKSTGKKVVIKTGRIYRTLASNRVLTIENVYEIPEMKLWEYTKELMVIIR